MAYFDVHGVTDPGEWGYDLNEMEAFKREILDQDGKNIFKITGELSFDDPGGGYFNIELADGNELYAVHEAHIRLYYEWKHYK